MKPIMKSSRSYLYKLSRWMLAAMLLPTIFLTSAQADVKDSPVNFQPTNVNEIIVKFKSSNESQRLTISQATRQLEIINETLKVNLSLQRMLGSGAQLVSLAQGSRISIEQVMTQLENRADVLYAVPNRRLYTMATPNDPRYNEQWHYFESTGGINMPAAWDINEGNGVVVAVIDTGYRPHVDLAANIVGGYDFISDAATARDGDGRDSDASDEGDWFGFFECPGAPFISQNSSWHGTHVAGTIAAINNNNTGVAGIAPNAKILPVRALGKCGGTLADIQDGMLWSAGIAVSGVPNNTNPAQVLNLSLGGGGACDASMQDVVDQVVAAGSTVVVAAGNSNADSSGFTPASCDDVITVASTNRNGAKASYSNFGNTVELAAPGGETAGGSANGVLSTLNAGTQTPTTDSYAFYQGTSMAAPHAAGVAALMYSHKPSTNPTEVLQVLQNTARAFPGTCNQCGAGIIDAEAALNALGGGGNQAPNAGFTVSTTGLSASFTDTSSDSDGTVVSWSWDFGDSNNSSAQNPSHTYSSAGTYTVTLTVTDDDGASDSSSQTVTVTDTSNQSPSASFTFTTSDLTADFTDTSSDSDGSVVSWSWDFGDSNNSSAQNPSHSYASAGTYTVTLTVTDDDGATNSTSQQVTVTAPPSNITLTGSTLSFWIFTQINLNWSGANGANVDIYENGSVLTTTANTGTWSQWRIGTVNSTFQVCEAGTANCSNQVTP